MGSPFLHAVRTKLNLPDGQALDVSFAFCGGADLTGGLGAYLTAGEARRALEFRHPGALQAHLRGRVAAKAALRELRGDSEPDFEIVSGTFGQPLVRAPHADLGVSISHLADAAIAAAFPVGWPLGIDLATIDRNDLETIRTQVSPDEERIVRALGLSSEQAATTLWAAKEALSKVLGGGLGIAFDMLAIESAGIAGPVLRLKFRHVGHLEADVLAGPRRVVALTMPYNAILAWDEIAPVFSAAGGIP